MSNNAYWLLTTEYPPFYGGGIGTYTYQTSKMLALHGHEVSIFMLDNSVTQIIETHPQRNIRLIRFGEKSLNTIIPNLGGVAKISWLFSVMVLKKIKEEGVPDFIESQDYQALAYYLLMEKASHKHELKDVKIIITAHTPEIVSQRFNGFYVDTLPKWWNYQLELRSFPLADGIVFISQIGKNEITKYLPCRLPINSIIHNPYEPDQELEYVPFEKSSGLYFFGKFVEFKGYNELLSAFSELIEEDFNLPDLICVGGDHFSEITGMSKRDSLIKKYGKLIDSGKIKFMGSMEPSKLQPLLNASKIIVIPSIFDNFPYAALEAMYLKRCIIMSNRVGCYEICKNNNDICYNFDPFNLKSLTESLKQALKIKKSDFEFMGANARKVVEENCSYNKIYELKQAFLNKINGKLPPKYHFLNLETKEFHISNETSSLLSIVIPYYNMGSTFEDTLRSIHASSYKPIEIIVVNASSTDAQSLIALEQFKAYYGYKVIDTPNRGLAASRNDGAKAAKGTYLAFLDPDDIVDHEFYERAIKILKHYENIGGVGQGSHYFGDAKGYWPCWNPEPPYILFHNTLCTSAMVYKTELFLKYGLNDESMIYGMEDYEALITLVENGVGVLTVPDIFLNYRVRKESMQRKETSTQRIQAFQMIQLRHENFYKKYALPLIALSSANGSGILVDNPSTFKSSV